MTSESTSVADAAAPQKNGKRRRALAILATVAIVAYGLWKSRGADTTDKYLRAANTMPWYASLRLLRQTRAGDWQAPLSALPTELAALRTPPGTTGRIGNVGSGPAVQWLDQRLQGLQAAGQLGRPSGTV